MSNNDTIPGQPGGYSTTMNVTHTAPNYAPGTTPTAAVGGAADHGLVGASTNSAELVRDSNAERFTHDVIDASAHVPVIVDFWSPRADPNLVLSPLLEKLVKRAGGLVHLVKVNVDENPQLAQQLRVQSIPTVFAFKDGKPVDAFQGSLGETQLQAFIDKLTAGHQSPVAAALEQANEALSNGDAEMAENIYSQIMAHDPSIIAALAGLIRAQALAGKFKDAREMIDALDAPTLKKPEVVAAISALDLAEQGETAGGDDTAELEAKLAKKENDHKTRFELAQALYATGKAAEAIEHLLYIARTKRNWNDEAARKQLIKIFEALGSEDPLTIEGRQQLSIILFS